MHTIEVPGGHVTLRDPQDLRQRDRRMIEILALELKPLYDRFPKNVDPREIEVSALGFTREEMGLFYDMQEATIFAYLESWDLPDPLPRSLDEVGNIRGPVYDVLRDATASLGATTAVPDFSASPDQDSPTGDSGASSRPSKAAPGSKSTRKSSRTGASSSSES